MRFIPTKFHAPLDYIVGAVLIAGPWIFQYSDSGAGDDDLDRARHRAHRLQPLHELRARSLERSRRWRCTTSSTSSPARCSPQLHGCSASPDEGANFWVPFVVIGVAAIFLGLTTKQAGGYGYRKTSTPTTA
jgi:hypothetical protein